MSTAPLPRIEGGRRARHTFPARTTGNASALSHVSEPTLVWLGTDTTLEALVRDHAHAAGLAFTKEKSPTAHVTVADPAALASLPSSWRPATTLVLITAQEPDPHTWRRALEIGARRVRHLPAESTSFLEDLTELSQTPSAAHVITCTPGSGGAGASSLATRLARAATRLGLTPLLIDADPYGGGLDVLVESAHTRGARWDCLTHAGDGSARAILDSLPVIDGIRILTFPPATSHAPPPTIDQITRVSRALTESTELTIIDAPANEDLLAQLPTHQLLMHVLGTTHSLSAATRRLDRLREGANARSIALSLRHPRGPRLYSAGEVTEMLTAPLALQFTSSPASHVPSLDVRRAGADAACLRYLKDYLS